MKCYIYSFVFVVFISAVQTVTAQAYENIKLAVYNTHSAIPFGRFAGLFTEVLHPGVEFTYEKNISMKQKHDLFWDVKAGYFFHRFVQHGISLYGNFGYRYKFGKRISADAALGGGYMQSIPAVAHLKLDGNGNYQTIKGIGRAQLIATFDIGAGFILNPEKKLPGKLFLSYQQRLQMPFVKSYIPILPYNSFMIGYSTGIQFLHHL